MRSMARKNMLALLGKISNPMARKNILALLGKISNLLIQESDSLVGVEDQIQWIESYLQENAYIADNMCDQERLRGTIYDVEDSIDELIHKSNQRRRRDVLIGFVLALNDVPEHFFYVLAVAAALQFKDENQLRSKWEQLKVGVSRAFSGWRFEAGSWGNSFDIYSKDTENNSFIAPLVREFEVLSSQMHLKPKIRKHCRWLRDEFRSLQGSHTRVASAEDSEAKSVWLEELWEVCRSAENDIGLFMEMKGLMKVLMKDLHQYKFSKQLARIKSQTASLSHKFWHLQRKLSFPKEDSDSGEEENVSTPAVVLAQDKDIEEASHKAVQGCFDEDVDAITAQLLKSDPRCLTVSIVGVNGIGKTSLARLIFDNPAVARHFPRRIWMSEEDINDFDRQHRNAEQGEIMDVLYAYMQRRGQNQNKMTTTDKSIIVLDHHDHHNWQSIIFPGMLLLLWERIKGAFREKSNGSRIILTFNNLSEAPPLNETDSTYRLHLRSDEESWALFTNIFKTNVTKELQDNLKKVILRKCGGLPKSIVKLGQILSSRDATLEEWSRVLDQHNEDEEPWSKIIEEINKTLPLHLRRRLFYFGLFPAHYNVPARRLIALWVAEGLGLQQDDKSSLESTAEEYLRELISRNMIQVSERKPDGKVKTCCLPEALRVHWFSKAAKATFLPSQSDSDSSSHNIPAVRRLADHLNSKDSIFDYIHGNNSSLFPSYRYTVSFLSFDTREGSRAGEDIHNFLDRCISSGSFHFLWVLDLENVYKPKLPKAVGKLKRLKYLGLRSTFLEVLPAFIDSLLNLQTLDLKRTSINILPNSIWKMQKLRHLFLDESSRSKFVPCQKDSLLQDLQTLWGVFIDEDCPVRNGLDASSNVKKLGLKSKVSMASRKEMMNSQLEAVANWVMNLKCLQSLRLKSFDESDQPWDLHLDSLLEHTNLSSVHLVGKLKNQQLVSKFPNNLIELSLSGSGLVNDDPMQILDQLPKLRILRLMARSFMGKKMLCSYGGFPKLEILKLWELNLLEEWIVEEGALPCLKDLEIRHCTNLKMVPDGLQHVKSLSEFKLTKMMELSTRIKDIQGEDWFKIAHVRNVCIQN